VEILGKLIRKLHDTCACLSDKRKGKNVHYPMADFGMAAFSVFFMQSPSFLAHQRRLAEGPGCGRSNCETLFEMSRIPSDNHVRAMLDPVAPDCFFAVFDVALEALEQSNGLSDFRRLGKRILIAFDGTEYFCSNEICCPNCSTRQRTGGTTEYFHSLLSATIVAPGHNRVVSLPPEFIAPQDGSEKQDCESRAARRWLEAHGAGYARFDPVYLGDDLYSRQPICEAVRAASGHFLFVCKPSSHKILYEWLAGIELPKRVVPVKRGKARFTHTYRWMEGVPLRDGDDAMTVNWLEMEIADATGKVTYRNSFVTDLPVDADTVAELVAAGRARWKIENESFNVLKTKGYNLEHNFGHGRENLSAVLATLNLLAFAFHTVAESTEDLWQKAATIAGTRAGLFTKMRETAALLLVSSWRNLFEILTYQVLLSQPIARPP
jgi:hypothetical protein